MRRKCERHCGARAGERGATLLEFTLGAVVFLSATFGVIEVSRLLWTHNALSDAVRRGARYAVTRSEDVDKVKSMVVYGNTTCTGQKMVNDLDPETQVDVTYVVSPVTEIFSYPGGKVTVQITDYDFQLKVPFVSMDIDMPDYRTTLTAESAGQVPDPIATPEETPEPTPTPGSTPPPPAPEPTPTPGPTPETCPCGKKGNGECKPCH